MPAGTSLVKAITGKTIRQKARDAAAAGVRNANIGAAVGMPAAGAGIGALAADEGEAGRGALLGGLAGLGGYAGLRAGGGKSLGQMYSRTKGRMAKEMFERGRHLEPGTAWQRMFSGAQRAAAPAGYTSRTKNLKRLIGAGTLGAGGAVGAGLVANRFLPQEPQSMLGQLTQGLTDLSPESLGLTPQTMQHLQAAGQAATPLLQDYIAQQQGQMMQATPQAQPQQAAQAAQAAPQQIRLTPEEAAYLRAQGAAI